MYMITFYDIFDSYQQRIILPEELYKPRHYYPPCHNSDGECLAQAEAL